MKLSDTSGEGVALVLAPHPDDEVFGCGRAIMRHVEVGDPVHVIFASLCVLPTKG